MGDDRQPCLNVRTTETAQRWVEQRADAPCVRSEWGWKCLYHTGKILILMPMGDKLSAHNIGFNAVRVTGVPTVMTSLVAVVCVRYEPDEFGQLHAIEERAVSPDGEFAGPAANAMFTPVTVAVRPGGNPERPESPYYHRQVFALDGMLLSDYGMYEIRILLDGNEVTTLYFEVQRDG